MDKNIFYVFATSDKFVQAEFSILSTTTNEFFSATLN